MTAATLDAKSRGIEFKAVDKFATDSLMLFRDGVSYAGDDCIHEDAMQDQVRLEPNYSQNPARQSCKQIVSQFNPCSDSKAHECMGDHKPFLNIRSILGSDCKADVEEIHENTDVEKPFLVRGNFVIADARIDSVEKEGDTVSDKSFLAGGKTGNSCLATDVMEMISEVEGADKPFLIRGKTRSADIRISAVGEEQPRIARTPILTRSGERIFEEDNALDGIHVEGAGLEMVDVDILHDSTGDFKSRYTADGPLWVMDRLRKERQVLNSFLETRHDALAHDMEIIFFKAAGNPLAGRKLIEKACAEGKIAGIPASSDCGHAATQDNHAVAPLRDTDTRYVSGRESVAKGIKPAIYGNNEASDRRDDSFEHEKMCHEHAGDSSVDESASKEYQSQFIDGRGGRISKESTQSALVRPGLKEDINNFTASLSLVEERKVSTVSMYRSPTSFENSSGGMGMMFEFFFGCLIVVNAFIIGFRLQYISFSTASDLGLRATEPEQTWPGAAIVFEALEHVVGGLFCLELIARFVTLKARFFIFPWHYFDTLVVLCWFAGMLRNIHFKPLVFRMIKLMRLVRLLRIVRFITIFDPLHLLVRSVMSSITLLVWSLALLLFIIMVTAMVVNQLLGDFLGDTSVPMDDRVAVFEQWGSMSRALETVFEITLGNWGPPCRLLQNTVDEWWVLFFVLYKCTIGFAVVQVITSVFIQQTFKVAARDEQVMINEKKAQVSAYLKNLESLFSVLDYSGDGFITLAELETCLEDSSVRAWFSALEVDIHETEHLFSLLDLDQDGSISSFEFIQGIKQLRGPARSIDVMCLNKILRRIDKFILTEMGRGRDA
eukprot:TRINITY_DN4454_c0_g2_i1.p1 TRINITY_DN4454_c0_g2~~TRINITY_DN4454_c0_g2_i1.p1  ORF type:complete len:855 (+),score=125.54 TRINITY_DN4454_c0_g2_i1:65-2566(+)